MKIALILASNICYAPYVYNYIKVIKNENVDCDIISWNKDNISEDNCLVYNEFSNLKSSRLFRFMSYFRFSKFVKKTINTNEYDRVIVFTIFLGLLLSPFLRNKFKYKYIFDIRDYSVVLKYFPRSINPLIKYSYKTTISSPGFLKWLPKMDKYELSHNYDFESNNFLINNKILKKKKILF